MTLDEANEVLSRLKDADTHLNDQQYVSDAIETLVRHWDSNARGVSMRGVQGAPDWLGFETRIWELGEALRAFLQKKKGWRGKTALLDRVAAVLNDRSLGKGRQTFALLLGDFGGTDYAEDLSNQLGDDAVCGHVIKALRKAKIGGFTEQVQAVAERHSGWIRNAARKYCEAEPGFRTPAHP